MEATNGIADVVTNLGTTLSLSNLWGVVGATVSLIGISVLFGLGFYLIKRLLNKIKKAKGGI